MERFQPTNTSIKASPQKNLTGSPRIIKDLAADIHANIQQWNSIYLHGLSILKSITAMKVDNSYSSGLQEQCNALENDIDQLDEIVINFKFIVNQIQAVTSLHGDPKKLFVTWPSERFAEFAEQIYTAYKEEAVLKRKIMENVAHQCDDSWKMLHLASWVHQPMIPHKVDALIESILNETGHR